MPSPLFTVAISFRNPGAYFALAVKSVLAQSIGDWELILIDDGSTDGTVEFANRIDDPRIRVFADGLNKSLSVRLNETAILARGKYYVRMDADDIMHPFRLERQLAALEMASNATVVGGECYSIDKDSKIVGIRKSRTVQQSGFAAYHSFIHPTVAGATEWFRKNPYSEELVYRRSEDAELWCRTTASSIFVNLDQPLLYYREMGWFSFDNYLVTGAGVLSLAKRYSRNPRECAFLTTREVLKLWVTSLATSFGANHWIIRNRFQPLDPEKLNWAERELAPVFEVELPMRSMPA